MRIGVDIDNTIICYEGVFALIARKQGFDVPLASSKEETKRWFKDRKLDSAFTILQGIVYGSQLHKACLFDDVDKFIENASKNRHQLFLVSHKTQYPILGESIDLRAAALQFLRNCGLVSHNMVQIQNIFFEDTIESKVARIGSLNLDLFIDDLIEVFEHPNYPTNIRSILFQKVVESPPLDNIEVCSTWWSIGQKILQNNE